MACTYLILFCKTSEREVSLRILQNVIQANWHLRDSRGSPPFCGQKKPTISIKKKIYGDIDYTE